MVPNEVFVRQAESIIKQSPDAGSYFVLYVDFTDLHSFNYIYGMEKGNALLKDAEDFLGSLDGICLSSRLFSDYFLCLGCLQRSQSLVEARNGLEARVQEFLEVIWARYPECRLNLACGICSVQESGIALAMDGANMARKLSKSGKEARVVLYSREIREETEALYEAERQIYKALVDKRFCFYLQPKVNLVTGEIVGAEALARRFNDSGEVIYPDKFLGMMEKNGSVVELDYMICRQVCAFLADRMKNGLPVTRISVNLSRLHIQNPETADQLDGIALEYGIAPKLLEFELTETILLEEFSGAKKLIDQLRARGYRVSIDDFGSGYAGINIWQELSFDCLKLDRRFLSEDYILKNRNEAIVPNIIDIAKRLHIEVLCEGVETEDQCRYLLRMGCNMVQGFFFERAVPGNEFFRIYEAQEGKYPLPGMVRTAIPQERPLQQKDQYDIHSMGKSVFKRMRPFLGTIVISVVFLAASIAAVLFHNHEKTSQVFGSMVTETLDAYTAGQRESTLMEIQSVTSTLQSLSVLFEREEDAKFQETYLAALNEASAEVKYMYLSYAEFQATMEKGEAHSEDIVILEQLKQGESIVTDVMYSKRMGNTYCTAVGMPVFRDGEFVGAVRGIINAKRLVSTDLYEPAQGQIVNAFLTDSSGSVIPVREEDKKAEGKNLLDLLEEEEIEKQTVEELRKGFSKNQEGAQSVRLGVFDGSPYYLAQTSLKYNDWHLVVILKADETAKHQQIIVKNTMFSIFGLGFAVLLASGALIYIFRKMQRKFSVDEQRYLLLERFSDTVLFNYDCRKDTIWFTSNASKFLCINGNEQKNFIDNLNQGYIYAGDRETVREFLTGRSDSEEFRIRMLRPDAKEYFWCMIQCQYLYEHEILTSVIGKITDIDEHMKQENYLLRMSETDGLTGLRNKASAEKKISDELGRFQEGMLFVFDLDNFKQINDHYGHAAGDLTLRYVGQIMRKIFRSHDVLGRIGGDEFLAFVGGLGSEKAAAKRVELLQKHAEAGIDAGTPHFTMSIGIARYPRDGINYQELFRAADQALYSAKRAGKRQFCFFEKEEMQAKSKD